MSEPRYKLYCSLCKAVVSSPNEHRMQSCKCGTLTIDGGDEYWRVLGPLSLGIVFESEADVVRQSENCAVCGAQWEELSRRKRSDSAVGKVLICANARCVSRNALEVKQLIQSEE